MNQLEIGAVIPPFSVQSTAGEITPRMLHGQQWVLYFYPKDATPGCTSEGQDFRDLHPEFRACNTELFGVSRDSLASHERFRQKQGFPFALISDSDETLCRLFDVIQEKNMYGRKVLGIERSTFLIDAEGRLARIWRKVKVKGHAAEVLAACGGR